MSKHTSPGNPRPAGRLAAALGLFITCAGLAAFLGRDHWLPFWQVRNLESGVELVDAGAEPRKPLAYGYTRAPRSFRSVSQSGLLRVRGPLQHDESYAPPVTARWEAGETTERFGVTRIAWRLAEAQVIEDDKVAGEAKREVEAALRDLAGLSLVTFLGPRGQLRIEPPASVSPLARHLVEGFEEMFALEMIVPLPSEPVGHGAKWTVAQDRSFGPAGHVKSVLTYRLDDTDGEDGFDVAVTLELTGDAQPALHAQQNVVVDQIEGSGAGRIVRMRREATPVRSDLVYQVGMSLTPIDEGQTAPTEAQRLRGYRVALRARELMQATDVGPVDWAEDPPEKPLAEN